MPGSAAWRCPQPPASPPAAPPAPPSRPWGCCGALIHPPLSLSRQPAGICHWPCTVTSPGPPHAPVLPPPAHPVPPSPPPSQAPPRRSPSPQSFVLPPTPCFLPSLRLLPALALPWPHGSSSSTQAPPAPAASPAHVAPRQHRTTAPVPREPSASTSPAHAHILGHQFYLPSVTLGTGTDPGSGAQPSPVPQEQMAGLGAASPAPHWPNSVPHLCLPLPFRLTWGELWCSLCLALLPCEVPATYLVARMETCSAKS